MSEQKAIEAAAHAINHRPGRPAGSGLIPLEDRAALTAFEKMRSEAARKVAERAVAAAAPIIRDAAADECEASAAAYAAYGTPGGACAANALRAVAQRIREGGNNG